MVINVLARGGLWWLVVGRGGSGVVLDSTLLFRILIQANSREILISWD